nr:hypothetical protein BaRGS_008057 [Batillaria attramentaria]
MKQRGYICEIMQISMRDTRQSAQERQKTARGDGSGARTGRTSVPRKLNLTVKDEEELVRHGLRVARTEGRKRVKRSVERMAGSLARRNGVPFKNGLPCPLWWCTSRQPAGYTPNTAITYWNILSEVPLPVLSDDVRQILQSGRPLEKKEIARVADETATFYHNSYNEQLYWSPVYRLIGQKMLHIYPSLACAEGHRPWTYFMKAVSNRIRQKRFQARHSQRHPDNSSGPQMQADV